MKVFKADLHIHTVLSPCASLEMGPKNIVATAAKKGLNIIAITDHNAVYNCKPTIEVSNDFDILVIPGIELNISDIHFLVYFPDFSIAELFQNYINKFIPAIYNDSSKIGYQLIVDKHENIIEDYPWLLISSLDASIYEIIEEVKKNNGIIIPAHIDRETYSILNVLGFIPEDLNIDGLEISNKMKYDEYKKLYGKYPFINSSDAHNLDDIGKNYTLIEMKEKNFISFYEALRKNNLKIL